MTQRPNFEEMAAAELNDWYLNEVGYRPQEDDPDMPDAELRELCIGMWDEVQAVRQEGAS